MDRNFCAQPGLRLAELSPLFFARGTHYGQQRNPHGGGIPPISVNLSPCERARFAIVPRR